MGFGFVFSGMEEYGWRFSVLVSAVFALIMLTGITFIPQSPRFTLLQAARSGNLLGPVDNVLMEDARRALMFSRSAQNSDEINGELQSIYDDAVASVGTRVAKTSDTFKYPRPLLIGCGIVFLQQV